MKIENIKPYEKNAKKHPKKQVEQVAKSIKEFGFNQPIVIDKKGVIIVGHGRYEAAKLLGLSDVPVIEVELTEEQAKAYRLADNKLNESEWEMDLVIEELKGLSEDMLDLTGFDKDLIIEPEDKDDDVPGFPKEPKSKLGDLYELGNHRVLCGDSTIKENVDALMGGVLADMVLSDQPYNMGYTGSATARRKAIANDNISNFQEFVDDFMTNMEASIKSSAPLYIFTSEKEIPTIKNGFINNGLMPSQVIIWKKHRSGFGGADYQHQYEPIVYGFREHKTRYMVDKRNLSDVWEFDRPTTSDLHPTMKPLALLAYALENSSKSDDIVLDLFLGSGSTLIACEKTNRVCYGMELDPKYIDVIIQRYVDYTGDNKIKKNGKEIIWADQQKDNK